jgi:hypothetical protein
VNDDHISELILRASAYLDGELTADEMARAEADPAVMAEVEALRALQEQLAAVEPPAADTRERAITAALDEFDLLHGAPAVAAVVDEPAPRVVPFRPRPAYTRWLTAAAAVVGIGVLGAVIAGSQGGDDESADLAAVETAAASATAEESARMEEAPLESDVEIAAAESFSTADEAPPEVLESAEPTAADSATATASEPAEGGGEPVATSPEITSTAPEPPVSSTTPPTVPIDLGDIVVDSDNLFEVGQQLLDQYNAGELPNTPETACTFGSYVVLSWARYDVGGTLRPAIIAGHPEQRDVGAFDPDTCEPFDVIVP